MAKDVSISSVDLLQGYNRRVKDFSSAVNAVMYVFRSQIEKQIEDANYKLSRAKDYHSRICTALDDMIQRYQKLIDSYNWDGESLNIINAELNDFQTLRNNANKDLDQIDQCVEKLTSQLNLMMNTASTFSLSNQSLVDSNISHINKVVTSLDQYVKTKTV